MKLEFNLNGQERKDLANEIGEIMGIAPVYAGAGGNIIDGERHRFSYVIMNITVGQNGEIIWDDRTDNETMNKVFDGLTERGYTFDRPTLEIEETPAFEDLQLTEREELGLGHERHDPPGEDGMQASDVPDDFDYGEAQHYPGRYANPTNPPTEEMLRHADAWMEGQPEYIGTEGVDLLTIEMPLDGFTEEAFSNLEKLIASKAGLIKKALGVERLTVEKAEHRIQFPWFTPGLEPEVFTAYAWFISALCQAAKEQKRVTAKEKPVDNEKFTFRVFLIRLGFIGNEYKNARKILLRNLTGNSAFKNGRPEPVETETAADNEDVSSLAETLADAELIHAVNASFESEGAENE